MSGTAIPAFAGMTKRESRRPPIQSSYFVLISLHVFVRAIPPACGSRRFAPFIASFGRRSGRARRLALRPAAARSRICRTTGCLLAPCMRSSRRTLPSFLQLSASLSPCSPASIAGADRSDRRAKPEGIRPSLLPWASPAWPRSRALHLGRAKDLPQSLWAAETALRSGVPAAVIAMIAAELRLHDSQRLHLAAKTIGIPLVLLHAKSAMRTPAVATRWIVRAAPAGRDRFGLMAHGRWQVRLDRCRNGRPGEWVLEWNHVAYRSVWLPRWPILRFLRAQACQSHNATPVEPD